MGGEDRFIKECPFGITIEGGTGEMHAIGAETLNIPEIPTDAARIRIEGIVSKTADYYVMWKFNPSLQFPGDELRALRGSIG